MAERTVSVALIAKVDGYRNGLRSAGDATEKFQGQVGNMRQRAQADMDGLSTKFGIMGAALAGVAIIAVRSAMVFDKQMSEVGAVANATADQMQDLRQAALDAGAATVYSASQAAEAEAELAKAGVSTADILGGGLTGALSLAASGSLELADAATIAAAAMNTFNLKGSDVEHVADVLSAAANKSSASVQDLGLGLQQVGLVAAQVGFTLDETVALLAALADRGLRGSDGATSLKTALSRLAAPTEEARALLTQYGISLYDANGQMVDAVNIAGQLQATLKDLSPAERNAALSTIFGSDAIRAANVLYSEGAEGIRDYIKAVNDQGAAARVAAQKLDNLSGDVEALKGSLETLFIQSGEGANGGLRTLVQTLTQLVNLLGEIPAPVLTAGTVIAALGGTGLLAMAATIKLSTSLREMKASLAAVGPTGVSAGRGLAMMALRATALTAAIAAATYGLEKVGAFGNDGKILNTKFLGDLADQLHVVKGNWAETADAIDEALAKMATGGRADEALATLHKIAEASGMTLEQAKAGMPEFTAALKAAGNMTLDQANAAESARKSNIQLAGAFGEAASEASGLKKAFDELNGSELTWRSAERNAEQAVDDLREKLEESNGSLDVHEEKGRAAAAAVDDLAQKAAEAAQAKYDETHSVEEANKTYNDYIAQLRQTMINAGLAADQVDTLLSRIARMPEYKALTVDISEHYTRSYTDYRAGERMRYGGISAASGSLRDAGVYNSRYPARYAFAEPGTGGEAFVPRNGDYDRSMGILSQAASWYGATVSGGGDKTIRVIVQDTSGRVLREQLITDALERNQDEATVRAAYP